MVLDELAAHEGAAEVAAVWVEAVAEAAAEEGEEVAVVLELTGTEDWTLLAVLVSLNAPGKRNSKQVICTLTMIYPPMMNPCRKRKMMMITTSLSMSCTSKDSSW